MELSYHFLWDRFPSSPFPFGSCHVHTTALQLAFTQRQVADDRPAKAAKDDGKYHDNCLHRHVLPLPIGLEPLLAVFHATRHRATMVDERQKQE